MTAIGNICAPLTLISAVQFISINAIIVAALQMVGRTEKTDKKENAVRYFALSYVTTRIGLASSRRDTETALTAMHRLTPGHPALKSIVAKNAERRLIEQNLANV